MVSGVKAAKAKFDAYSLDWGKAYLNEQNGGFNVYHRSHQFSNTRAQGALMTGSEAEKFVGRKLAELPNVLVMDEDSVLRRL